MHTETLDRYKHIQTHTYIYAQKQTITDISTYIHRQHTYIHTETINNAYKHIHTHVYTHKNSR